MYLYKLLFLSILCELIVELVVKSELFEPITSYFVNRRGKNTLFWYIGGFLSCGYCFSVYIGIILALIFRLGLPEVLWQADTSCLYWVGVFISGLVVHRGSTVWHNIIDKYTNKYYDLRFRKKDDVIITGDMDNE